MATSNVRWAPVPPSDTVQRTILISGASRGIGHATALRLAADGWQVYAGVRTEADGRRLAGEAGRERIVPVTLDVTDAAQIAALDERLPERLDAVINNAGVVVDGPLEALSTDQVREQFEVNVFGAHALTRAVLPRIRSAAGRILFVSSVSGRVSTPMTGAYNGSKFALEGMADALRVELRPWGIRVILIEPNSTATDLWDKAPERVDEAAAGWDGTQQQLYARHLTGFRRTVKFVQRLAVPVEDVVGTIERALEVARPRARYPVGAQSRVQLALTAITPTRVNDAFLARATGTPRRL